MNHRMLILTLVGLLSLVLTGCTRSGAALVGTYVDPLSGARLELGSSSRFQLVLPDGDIVSGEYRYDARNDAIELHMETGGIGQANLIDGCVVVEGQSVYLGTDRQFQVTYWDQLPPLVLLSSTRPSPSSAQLVGEYTHGSGSYDLREIFSEDLVLKADGQYEYSRTEARLQMPLRHWTGQWEIDRHVLKTVSDSTGGPGPIRGVFLGDAILCVPAGWRNFEDDGPGIEKWSRERAGTLDLTNPLGSFGG